MQEGHRPNVIAMALKRLEALTATYVLNFNRAVI